MVKLYTQRLRDLHNQMQKDFEIERRELKEKLKHAETMSGKVRGHPMENGPEEFKMEENKDSQNIEVSLDDMYGTAVPAGSSTTGAGPAAEPTMGAATRQ